MNENFSRQADLYAKYRPSYPAELFEFVIKQVKEKHTAWDCATGNGQAAQGLAPYFNQVFATDISQRQIDHAYRADNIFYSIQPAEKTEFDDNSFDLITISQALHWFQFDEFYKEVKRVSKSGGWIAAWMYSLIRISPAIDKIFEEYHFNIIGSYYETGRKYVDEYYRSIPFPFKKVDTPIFKIEYRWTINDFRGYLNTSSALQKFISVNHYSPVDSLLEKIQPHWTHTSMLIIFPLYLLMGQIKK